MSFKSQRWFHLIKLGWRNSMDLFVDEFISIDFQVIWMKLNWWRTQLRWAFLTRKARRYGRRWCRVGPTVAVGDGVVVPQVRTADASNGNAGASRQFTTTGAVDAQRRVVVDPQRRRRRRHRLVTVVITAVVIRRRYVKWFGRRRRRCWCKARR